MKSIKYLLMLAIGMMALISVGCSNDIERREDGKTVNKETKELAIPVIDDNGVKAFHVFFPSSPTKPLDLSAPVYYQDAERTRPITLAYWECKAGTYTNGTDTYHITIVEPGTPNAYMMIDHFSQTVYWVTTSWGGDCSTTKREAQPQTQSLSPDECLTCDCYHVEGTYANGVEWLVALMPDGNYYYWDSSKPDKIIKLNGCNGAKAKVANIKSIN